MRKFSRLDVGTKALVTLVFVISGALTLGMNQYKSHYQKEEPVGYEEARSSYPDKVGYPASDDIPVAKSIEDIMSNEYCTIEVSKDDIESTRVFLIKDRSEAGKKSGKMGRRYTLHYVDESYFIAFEGLGDFSYMTRQIDWNMMNTSYGEWCVVRLENGDKIYVLVDLKLLNLSSNKKIKLPIGEIVKKYNLGKLSKEYENFGVLEENSDWYVDMVGDWEDREVGDINVVLRLAIVLVIVFITLVFILELYDKRKKEGI